MDFTGRCKTAWKLLQPQRRSTKWLGLRPACYRTSWSISTPVSCNVAWVAIFRHENIRFVDGIQRETMNRIVKRLNRIGHVTVILCNLLAIHLSSTFLFISRPPYLLAIRLCLFANERFMELFNPTRRSIISSDINHAVQLQRFGVLLRDVCVMIISGRDDRRKEFNFV